MGRASKQAHGAPHERDANTRQAATSWERHKRDREERAAILARRRAKR